MGDNSNLSWDSLTLQCVFVFLSTIAEIQYLNHQTAIAECVGDVIELQCEREPANILSHCLLLLSSPSFSNKFLDVAKLQLVEGQVCCSAVSCNWCFIFLPSRIARATDSAQHLLGSDFNLQSNMKYAFLDRSHMGYLSRNSVQGYSCKLEVFPGSERDPQLRCGYINFQTTKSQSKRDLRLV